MTHTPGPWEVIYCNRDLPPHVVSKLRFKPVDVMIGDKRLRVSENESGDADARLIAAAPELLACLKLAADIIGHPDDDASKLIAEVIAKAEGR